MAKSYMLGLYIHVPFCSAICNYCNFNRGLFDAALKARYVDALVSEIERAGWQQETPHETSSEMLERAHAYYDNPTFKNMMNEYVLKVWRIKNAWLEVGLYRNHSAGEIFQGRTLTDNVYTINLSIVQDE